MADYEAINQVLFPHVQEQYLKIFPIRRRYLDHYNKIIWKKCYEVGRYVLPVAIHAYLYHTISALTLMRYHRLVNYFDTPWEQKLVVEQMVQSVREVDPEFERELQDPYPLDQTPEYRWLSSQHGKGSSLAQAFIREFDASLGESKSVLIDYKANAPQTLASAVRSVLGIPSGQMSDADAIDRVLNPAKNPYLGDTLNVNTLSKLSRTLFHVHYTFRKKLSHTADSQDQRHRMAPGSRPILEAQFTGQADFIVPKLIREVEQAEELYLKSMEKTFRGIEQLLSAGLVKQFALYLLPNAFPIRFEESGDLLNLHHKWHARACYTAQEEIFYATIDELKAVQEVHPQLVRHILAPCYIRKEAGLKPICPEGDRFCGVKVWQKDLAEYERVI
jgi:thymidylate synthase ThyX